MKCIVPFVVLFALSVPVEAADNQEIEALKQQIQSLQETIRNLQKRVHVLEVRQATTAKTQQPKPVDDGQELYEFQYKIHQIIPKVKIVGRRSYEVQQASLTKTSNNKWRLTFDVLYRNRERDEWKANREKYILKLPDVDVNGFLARGGRYSSESIAQNQRAIRKIAFDLDEPVDELKKLQTQLSILSAENRQDVVFKMELREDFATRRFRESEKTRVNKLIKRYPTRQ